MSLDGDSAAYIIPAIQQGYPASSPNPVGGPKVCKEAFGARSASDRRHNGKVLEQVDTFK